MTTAVAVIGSGDADVIGVPASDAVGSGESDVSDVGDSRYELDMVGDSDVMLLSVGKVDQSLMGSKRNASSGDSLKVDTLGSRVGRVAGGGCEVKLLMTSLPVLVQVSLEKFMGSEKVLASRLLRMESCV